MFRINRALTSLIALPGLALIVAGCGSGGGGVATASSSTKSASSDNVLKVADQAKVGRVLVDAQGRTLYRYTPDHGGRSTCLGTCAALWPPALAPRSGSLTASGVKGTVATTTRPGGARQLTFNGKPLYRFAQDTSTADANGQGVDHIWFVIPATGASAPASAPSPPAAKPQSSYGY